MFTAQNTKSAAEAILPRSASASSTVMSANFSGTGEGIAQRPATASRYFFPAEEGEAASAATLNQGWFSSSRQKRCPTMPVAPMTATLYFFILYLLKNF